MTAEYFTSSAQTAGLFDQGFFTGMAMTAGLGWPRDDAVWFIYQSTTAETYEMTEPVAMATDNATAISITTCLADDTYYYARCAVSSTGYLSDMSDDVPVIITGGAWIGDTPLDPTNLTATLLSGGLIQLTWKAAATQKAEIDGYKIYQRTGTTPDVYTLLGTTTYGKWSNKYRYTTIALAESAQRLKVVAYNGALEATGVTVDCTPDATGPDALDIIEMTVA